MQNTKIHINPFYKFIFAFIFGILTAVHFTNYQFLNTFCVAMLAVLLLLLGFSFFKKKYTSRWVNGLLINALFFLVGYGLVIAHSDHYNKHHFMNVYEPGDEYIGYVNSRLDESRNSYKATWEITHIKKAEELIPVNGKVLTFYPKSNTSVLDHSLGRYFKSTSRLDRKVTPANPNEFDYSAYLANKKIYFSTYVFENSKGYALLNRHESRWIYLAYQAQSKLLGILEQAIPNEENFSVASALLLGYKNHITDMTSDNFKGSGAMHVLAVSGLHANIIAYVLSVLLFFMRGRRSLEIIKYIILIILMWMYVFITGMSPSVSRAVTMITFFFLGKMINKKISLENIIAASAFLLLWVNPFFIKEVGFQLSYSAVYGIIYFYPKIQKLWVPNIANKYLFKAVNYIWILMCVSFAAQLGTFPLSLYYFHLFPNYFLVSNLFIIPMASFVINGGVLMFIFYGINESIGLFFGKIVNGILTGLNYVTSSVNALPFSRVDNIYINEIQTLIIYLTIFSFLLLLVFVEKKKIKYALQSFQVAVVFLIGLTGYSAYQHHVAIKQRSFAVFEVKNDSAIQVVLGKKAYTILDPGRSDTVSEKIEYAYKNQLGYQKVRHHVFLDLNKDYRDSLVCLKNGVLFYLDQKVAISNHTNFPVIEHLANNDVDARLVLRNNKRLNVEEVISNNILLDGSNKTWYYEKFKFQDKPVHFTTFDGAHFVKHIN